MIEIVFHLVLTFGANGIAVVQTPFHSEASCRAEAARISRPKSEGGVGGVYASCIRVEAKKPT